MSEHRTWSSLQDGPRAYGRSLRGKAYVAERMGPSIRGQAYEPGPTGPSLQGPAYRAKSMTSSLQDRPRAYSRSLAKHKAESMRPIL